MIEYDLKLFQQPDPWVITFNHGDSHSYLRFWKDGRVEFEGNADAAAKVFFEAVAVNFRDMKREQGW